MCPLVRLSSHRCRPPPAQESLGAIDSVRPAAVNLAFLVSRVRGPPLPCASPPDLSVSFTGDRRVQTISINQVLSNQSLINFNKFAQV